MKIIATHLLNDFSGSPKVLKQLLQGWVKNDLTIELHTCGGKEGFLSDIAGVGYYHFNYDWAANPFIRLINLLVSQLALCLNILRNSKKEDIVYINTVLPFGAALAGKIKGNRIIYHIHETSVKPAILKAFLFGMVRWTASDVIYVSNYLAQQEPIKQANMHILHNAIEDSFLARANNYTTKSGELKNILMVCSLKEYKGVDEFIKLASILPDHNFKLVLNASSEEIANYFQLNSITKNVELFATQADVHPFYQWADLVLNLSRPDEWIETFGLTIIEGMAYGNPAIVPPVGGVTEVVSDGQNGFHIACHSLDEIAYRIAFWSESNSYFNTYREAAKNTVTKFNEQAFITRSIEILTTKNNK